MNKSDRQKVFEKYDGRCAYCGCKLNRGWHLDHIEPIVRNSVYDKDKCKFVSGGTMNHPERDILSNYNPSCQSCNIQKNSFTVEQFRANIQGFINSLNNYNTQYKFAKKYGLVKETNSSVVFYFENFKSK